MRQIPRNARAAMFAMAGILLLGSCASGDDQTVVVFAASSLTVVMDEIVEQFEAAHPGVTVEVNFAGSPTLREQIDAGAPAHVVILANEAVMQDLVDSDLVETPASVASNTVTLAVAAVNSGQYPTVEAALDSRHLLGICAASVPCGSAARDVLSRTGFTALPDTETANVRSLVTNLMDGELDLAFIYNTDVVASNGELVSLALLGPSKPTSYPAAVVTADEARSITPNLMLAEEFVEFLGSPTARDLFAAMGFGPPL